MEAGRASPHRGPSAALGPGLGLCPATGELCVLLTVPSPSCAGLPNRLLGSKEHRLCLGRCRCRVTRCFEQSCGQLVWRWEGALGEVRDTGRSPPGPAASAPRSLLNVHLVSERWEPPWVSAAKALSPPTPGLIQGLWVRISVALVVSGESLSRARGRGGGVSGKEWLCRAPKLLRPNRFQESWPQMID